ncbi:MAG: HEAT repeat domain-containing protein [Candidatus Brocadiaceae bacterium]|jgi:HEAT repeat protein
MARRGQLDEQEIRARAREALTAVRQAEDREAAAVQALEGAPGARVRRAIVEAVTGRADEVTSAVLSAALESGYSEAAQTAVELLVDLSGTPAGIALLREALRSGDAALRRRAVEAIESFSEPELVSSLARGLTDEDQAVRRSATGTLGIIIGTPSHGLRQPMLDHLERPDSELAQAVVANEDVQVRRQVAQGLAFVDSDAVLPTVERLARDEDDEVRQEAVFTLAAIGTPDALAMMAERLEDSSYRVVSSVLDMLAGALGSGSRELLDHLRQALDHELPEVRRHVVLMLNRYPPSEIEDVLQEARADPDFEVSRHAAEMMRKLEAEDRVDWLAEEMSRQVAGERARTVWEAGDIAQEQGVREGGREVVPFLEQALLRGSSSEKVHALNELSSLVDIGDSEAMRAALEDEDSSVRSRAADTLSYTRNAGLLVGVLHDHWDPMVRRRAAEALIGNPGGPKEAGRIGSTVTFTSARTFGVALFGHLLQALRDEDPGVQQHACEGIRECARMLQLLPLRETLRELNRLIEDESVSVLLREDAEHAAETVREITYDDTLAEGIEEVLQWRAELAREAHAVQWDEDASALKIARSVASESVERWITAFGLPEQEAERLREAASSEGPLSGEVAGAVLEGLGADLVATLRALAHGAGALRLIGCEGHEEALEEWVSALSAGPRLQWGDSPERQADVLRLQRLRRWACMEARRALHSFRGRGAPDFLDELLGDEDDWVRLAGMVAHAETEPERAQLEEVAKTCEKHLDDAEYCRPVGWASRLLLGAGIEDGVRFARSALAAGDIRFRMELTHGLIATAQEQRARRLVQQYLADRQLDDPAHLWLAAALRGAGGSLSDAQLPEAPDGLEQRCACLGLRAMANDAEAAQELKAMLRDGSRAERYLSACFLDLARVWSAVLIFSSVRDQDVAYSLRLLCAASLVRAGHPGGLSWFTKIAQSVSGRAQALRVTHMARAVEDVAPLMLKCSEVNVGRFV